MKPLIQTIDTWFLNRRLGVLYEAKVGNGNLMVCSLDIENNLEERPVARQLKYSMEKYMASNAFQPNQSVEWEVVKDVFEDKKREKWDSFNKSGPDELMPTNQNKD